MLCLKKTDLDAPVLDKTSYNVLKMPFLEMSLKKRDFGIKADLKKSAFPVHIM